MNRYELRTTCNDFKLVKIDIDGEEGNKVEGGSLGA